MIYCTGDTHGNFSELKENIRRLQMTSGDCCVILGDAGFNFHFNMTDVMRKQTMNACGVPLLCAHGNHEARPARLPSYELREWHGGMVWAEPQYPNLLFAKDGEIYNLDGKRVIVIGGAYSVDKLYRIAANPCNPKWWADEQPGPATKEYVEQQLASCGWKVDAVLSHTCPAKYIPTEMFLEGMDQNSIDQSTEEWLDTIEARLDYKKWFCGHWHTNKRIDKMHFLFHEIETLV